MTIHEKSKIRLGDDGTVRVKQILNCARCGGTHEHVLFNKFTDPIECNGMIHNYWTLCPTNGQPIIMARESDQEEKPKNDE